MTSPRSTIPPAGEASGCDAQGSVEGGQAFPAGEPLPGSCDGPLLYPELHSGTAVYPELHGFRRPAIRVAAGEQAAIAGGDQHTAGVHHRCAEAVLGSDIHGVHDRDCAGVRAGGEFAELLGAGGGFGVRGVSGECVAPAGVCAAVAAVP